MSKVILSAWAKNLINGFRYFIWTLIYRIVANLIRLEKFYSTSFHSCELDWNNPGFSVSCIVFLKLYLYLMWTCVRVLFNMLSSGLSIFGLSLGILKNALQNHSDLINSYQFWFLLPTGRKFLSIYRLINSYQFSNSYQFDLLYVHNLYPKQGNLVLS